MKNTFHDEFKLAFAMDEKCLRELYEIIRKLGDVEIEIDCSDSISRQFASIEECLNYQNAKARKILSIGMRALNGENYIYVKLMSPRDIEVSRVSIYVSGNEEFVSVKKDNILDVIEGSKVWYAAIYKINFMVLTISILYLIPKLVLIGLDVFGIPLLPDKLPDNDIGSLLKKQNKIEFILLLYLCFLFLFGMALNKIRDALFPSGIFLIGQEIQKHGVRKNILFYVVLPIIFLVIPYLIQFIFEKFF